MKFEPAKPTPSYQEMEAYESGYNMATEVATIPAQYADPVLQQAFVNGWQDKLNSDLAKEVLPHA